MASSPNSAARRDSDGWTAADLMTCWSCHREHEPSFFCPACNAIQPYPDHADYFEILGVPRCPFVDVEAMQKRYYELHRRLHPDLFQTGPPEARQASLRNTAAVNQAFRTLRDPVDRGLYWLTLQGEALGSNNNRVPPALAALVFEVQEKLEEYRDADSQSKAALESDIRAIRNELQSQHDDLMQRLQSNFQNWRTTDAGTNTNTSTNTLRADLKTVLSELAYLSTLKRDVDAALEH